MATDCVFEKDDRVKVVSGKLKGNKGYVRYVGTVEKKEDAIYVGVELDDPNGKHDGKVKGKRYFKCRDKYGYMAPMDSFELFGKSKKKKAKKEKKPKASLDSLRNARSKPKLDRKKSKTSLSSKSTATTPAKDKPAKGKKKKPKKEKSATPITDDAEPSPSPKPSNNPTDDTENQDTMNLLSPSNPTTMAPSTSASPIPIVTQIEYKDQETQTDIKLSVVNDDNDIAQVSKEVAEAHAQMIQSLRGQIDKLNSEIAELKSKNLKLENDQLTKNDLIEMLTIEKEANTEDIDALRFSVQEKDIEIANLKFDIEDLKDERDKVREEYVMELETGQQDVDEILEQNRVLKETIEALKKTALQELTEKNDEILQLKLEVRKMPKLQKHIEELERDLSYKMDLENELNEFKAEIDLRSDTDKVIEVLSTKNVELEYEVKRLMEVNKHLENLDSVYNDIEKENEQYINDLNEELKNKDIEMQKMHKKMDKAVKDLKHSQNTLQKLKDHARKLEDTKRKMSLRENNMATSKKEQQLQKEMLLRSNLELLERVNLIKKELINYSKIAAKGFSHSVENMILQQHIPKQVKCDFGAIEFLGFLQRISFKARFCKEVLDSFYIAAESTVGGDIAAPSNDTSENDIKDTYKVLELCPILVKQDRFIEAVQRALIASYVDRFNDAVTHWAVLLDAEDKYDAILRAVEENDIRGGISLEQINKCNDLFRSFLLKNYAEFSPEQKLRAKDKIDKWGLYQVLQELKYKLYTMQLKMRELNDCVARLSASKDQNNQIDQPLMNGGSGLGFDDDSKLMNGGSFNPTDDYEEPNGNVGLVHGSRPEERQVEIGTIQKLESLQSDLTGIVRRALQYCGPTRCQLFGNRSNLNKLQDENYIGVEFDFVERTAQMMRFIAAKQVKLLQDLGKIDTEISRFDRVGKINRLLDDQSELSSTGLVVSMEDLYKHIKGLPYALEQLYTSKVKDVDAPDHKTEKELNAIAMGQIHPDKLYYMHMELEQELRDIKNRRTMIRSPETERKRQQDELDSDDPRAHIRKKKAPWIEKAKVIREELEQADMIRDALESAQAEIKYKQKELLLEKSATKEVKARMEVVQLQLAKHIAINRDLVHFETEAKASEERIAKFRQKNKELETKQQELMKTTSDLQGEVAKYKSSVQKLKQKSKRNVKNLHDDDDHIQSHAHPANLPYGELRRVHSVTGVAGGRGKAHRRSGSLNLTPKGRDLGYAYVGGGHRNGKGLGLGEPSASYDALDRPTSDERMIITQLRKQLDDKNNYNSLLQKTINSLRHTHNIYDLNKQWIELKRDLRPLPSFSSMTDSEYKQYIQRKEHLKHKKEIKKMQKRRRREKLLAKKKRSDTDDFLDINDDNNRNLAMSLTPSPKKGRRGSKDNMERSKSTSSSSSTSEDEDEFDIEKSDDETKDNSTTDDEHNDEEEKKDHILSSYEQKQIKKKRYQQMQKSLNTLDSSFGAIYSCPRIVNLCAKNKQNDITYDQEVIGRNLKLRDIKLQCMKLSKECKDIESNFNADNNKNVLEEDKEQNLNHKLVPLGKVDISGLNENKLNSLNNNKNSKVCLSRNNIVKLQNYLNILC